MIGHFITRDWDKEGPKTLGDEFIYYTQFITMLRWASIGFYNIDLRHSLVCLHFIIELLPTQVWKQPSKTELFVSLSADLLTVLLCCVKVLAHAEPLVVLIYIPIVSVRFCIIIYGV